MPPAAGSYSSNADEYRVPAKLQEAERYLSVAERRVSSGDVGAAYKAALEAVAVFTEVGDLGGAAEARAVAAKQLAADSRFHEARKLVEKGLADCQSAGHVAGEAKAMLGLADVCMMKPTSEHRLEAVQLATQARALSQGIQEHSLEIAALLELSNLHLADAAGDGLQKSMQAAEDACALARQEGDSLYLGLALRASSRALAKDGQRAAWQTKAAEALHALRGIGNKRLEASQLLVDAKLHLADADAKAALASAQQAQSILIDLRGNDVEAVEVLVDAHLKLGAVGEAVNVAQECVERQNAAHNARSKAAAQELLMTALSAHGGREEEASDTARAAALIYQELKETSLQCKVLRSIAGLHAKKKQLDRAILMAQEALAAAKAARHQEEIVLAMEAVTEACLASGKREKALKAAEMLRNEHLGSGAEAAACLATAAALLEGEAEKAGEAAREAHALAETAGLRSIQAKALMLSAEACRALGKPKAAMLAAQRASRTFKQECNEQGTARALVEAGRAEIMQLETGVREPTQTAWEAALQGLQEAVQRSRTASDDALTAAALGLLARVQAALGLDKAPESAAEAAQLLRKVGTKMESSVAILALETPPPTHAAVKGSRAQAEKDAASLVLMPLNPDETEAERIAFERQAAVKALDAPSSLVRDAGGLLVEARTSLPFKVAQRRDVLGQPVAILARYCRQASSAAEVPLMEVPAASC
eukprot:TRINITY_DN27993_c0_g1_i1.p1 TRINITY_DN27993_c0_g1~~TRINITY_DN27993_c0_g1_i1.p1  ORF type:complete len:713 (-),score=226.95 TRINITY_DN27993_c0_g1_i1:126-2264(-)